MPSGLGSDEGGAARRSTPLNPTSLRILVASTVGVLILLIWLTGTIGDSHRVTLLALSVVSILGLGLVLQLRRRFVIEAALLRAKEEADDANRSKSQFLATMSHELRTPLNGIIGFAEIMKTEAMGPIGNEQYRSYVADIQQSGTHLLAVINDILDLTKAEVGLLDLNEDVVDVAEVVQAIARLTRVSIQTAGLTLGIDVPAGLRLRADERRLRQILFNLIGNAVKFTPQGGKITVGASRAADGGIRIIVADTGIGIASQDLDRVLEPFVQIDSAVARQYAGTGLGLPAVKAMIELHGGHLDLHSEPNRGTTATITFPPDRTANRSPAGADATHTEAPS